MRTLLFSISLVFLLSCGEEPALPGTSQPEEEPKVQEDMQALDTIYRVIDSYENDWNPLKSDTTFLIDGTEYTLELSVELNGGEKVYADSEAEKKDGKIYITRYAGRDLIYLFRLKNKKRRILWEKTFTKKDYIDSLGDIVPRSGMSLPQFKTYLSSTKQLVFTQDFWVPASDVGVQGIVFFDLKGKPDIKFHRWFASSGSDCEVVYAPDSSFLLTCSEIISPNGKRTKITKTNAFLAGSMIIGDRHVFVSYALFRDSSFHRGRLYNQYGKIVKEFEFDGYDGALGYSLPRHYLKKFGRYYFVDEQNKFILMIPEKKPTAFKKYPFKNLRYSPEELDLDTTLILQKEVNDHRFGIDSLGEVRTYQVGDFTGKWMFFDEKTD